MEIAEKSIKTYKNVMLGLLVISVCGTFIASYLLIGPFIGSPAHIWLKDQTVLAPILKDLIDVEPMILDALVKATYPMFAVWSVVFFVYPYFKSHTDSFNSYIKVTSLFFGGPSWILFLLGSGCLGVGVYAIIVDSINAGLGISVISLIMFIFPAWYFRRYKTVLVSKDNKLMGKCSNVGGWVFSMFAFIGYLWSIFADPVRTLISIYDACPCS